MSAPEVVFGAAAYATETHPLRVRPGTHAAAVQPPGADRRAGGDARLPERWPGRHRLGPVDDSCRALRVRHRSRSSPAPSGRRGSRPSPASWRRKTSSSTASSSRCRRGPSTRAPSSSRTRRCGSVASDPATLSGRPSAGLGMLFFALKADPESLRASIRAYRDNIGDAEPICGAVNNQTAGFVNGLCGRDSRRRAPPGGRQDGRAHLPRQHPHARRGGPTGRPRRAMPTSPRAKPRTFYDAITADRKAVADSLLEGGFVMAGDPERLRPHPRLLLRGGRRPGDHPHADGQRPARADHGVDRADRHRADPEVPVTPPPM